MFIEVVNPNTTWSMTATMGPPSIESHYDEALAVPGILTEIEKGERDGVDGYVIACFGDPGLDAARELAGGPVVGIAEAAMRAAAVLGRGFSVVTTLARTTGRAWDLAHRYGMRDACRGVHACDLPVLALDSDPDARRIVTEACLDALSEDGSDTIVLGCAGMADLCAHISAEIGVPVVDGVAAATLTVPSLVTMGLATGKRGEFATPPPKRYAGLLDGFTTGG